MELNMSGVHFILLAIFIARVQTLCAPEHPQNAACRAKFVVKAKILSLDWERDERVPTTRRPRPTLPTRRDWGLLEKGTPDPYLVNLFKDGSDVATGESFLGEPALLPRRYQPKPKYIRVRLEKRIRGMKYLTNQVGHEFSILFSSMHRIPYKVGKIYLLTGFVAGKELVMNECNWFSEWDKLTPVIHEGLRRFYWIFCGCQIKTCYGNTCNRTVRQCEWPIANNAASYEKVDYLSRNRVCMVYCGRSCQWQDPRVKPSCY